MKAFHTDSALYPAELSSPLRFNCTCQHWDLKKFFLHSAQTVPSPLPLAK